jgi:CheY-like chemotaxis protein
MVIPTEQIASIPRPVELVAAAAEKSPGEVAMRDLAGMTILVVDDHADARDLMQLVLGNRSARVVCAANAQEALALVESERPHVLVSDISMPVVDGYELLRRVRELGAARGGDVPAIALTAFACSEDRARALRAGFVAHLAKPVEPLELVATIASAA